MSHGSAPAPRGGVLNFVWGGVLVFYHLYVAGVTLAFFLALFGVSFAIADAWVARVVAIGIASLLVLMLAALGVLAAVYPRKARYAEVLTHFQQFHFLLRRFQHGLRNLRAAEEVRNLHALEIVGSQLKRDFELVLTHVDLIFSVSSGKACRVSIKHLGKINPEAAPTVDNLYVKTLARDSASAVTCEQKDAEEGETHRVTDNTDFEHLIRGFQPYFYVRNVNTAQHYRNSSESYWRQKSPFAARFHDFRLAWLLPYTKQTSVYPYTSALTLPIRGDASATMPGGLVGFLCIDSLSRVAFWERFDIPLAMAMADALYGPLTEYGEYMSETREKLRRHDEPI